MLNVILNQRNNRDIILTQNDSLARAFDEFQRNLKKTTPETYSERENNNVYSGNERDFTYNRSNTHAETTRANNYTPFPKAEKLAAGETISLNSGDTAQWKKVPGIGSAYAARIAKYGEKLGGFVSIEQLREVYGMDNEMFAKISPYIKTDGNFRKIRINKLEFKELLNHPYLNYKQVQAIMNLRKKKGNILSVNELSMLNEFTSEDLGRIEPYLEF